MLSNTSYHNLLVQQLTRVVKRSVTQSLKSECLVAALSGYDKHALSKLAMEVHFNLTEKF